MKLLVSVVNGDDAYPLLDALTSEEYRATLISTSGGFLREGNSTLLIGVADERVSGALEIIRANCRARTAYVNPVPPATEFQPLYTPTPIEVRVGGAVVFVLDVERYERF